MIIERFKLSIAEDAEGYITDKIEHKTYFLRGDTAKKEITGILNQLYNENEDLKTDISVLNRHYDKYANICAKLKKENEQLYELINFANTLIAFKTSESCQKEWKKKIKEVCE